MSKIKKINAAIIGMGFIGRQHYDALRRLPGVHIRAVCASSLSAALSLQNELDADYVTANWVDVIKDLDIDVIHNCTPNILHDEINLAAIAAAKHIYAEKPLSLTAEGAEKAASAAKAAGVANAVNYQYRMNAAVQEMRNRIAAGKGGRPLYISGGYMQDSAARHDDYTARRMPETSPARALLDIGVHWADTVSFVAGTPIKRVYAKMYTHYPIRTDPRTGNKIEIHSDDTTSVLVEFDDGTPGSAIFSKCMLGHKNDLFITFSGEDAEFSWRQENCGVLHVGHRETGNERIMMDKQMVMPETADFIEMPAGHAPGWQEAEKNAMAAFYASVRDGSYLTGRVPYATFDSGAAGNRFVDACILSARENRWVEV